MKKLMLSLVVLVAACGGKPAPKTEVVVPAAPAVIAPAPPAKASPAKTPPPPAPKASPRPAPSPPDTCGARDLQRLIGRPRSEIPIPIDPSKRRVACSTCPVTMDYREDRLNIFYNAETGVIEQVKCG